MKKKKNDEERKEKCTMHNSNSETMTRVKTTFAYSWFVCCFVVVFSFQMLFSVYFWVFIVYFSSETKKNLFYFHVDVLYRSLMCFNLKHQTFTKFCIIIFHIRLFYLIYAPVRGLRWIWHDLVIYYQNLQKLEGNWLYFGMKNLVSVLIRGFYCISSGSKYAKLEVSNVRKGSAW